MKEILEQQTDYAIEELYNSLKKNHSFATLENWLNKNKEIELETLKYTFEENKFGDFWSLFYWIENIVKFFLEKEIVVECIGEFNNLDKYDIDKVYLFLLKYESLLKNFNLPTVISKFDYNSKLLIELIKFTKLPEFIDAKYLQENISSKVIVFFYLKNMQKFDESKLKEVLLNELTL